MTYLHVVGVPPQFRGHQNVAANYILSFFPPNVLSAKLKPPFRKKKKEITKKVCPSLKEGIENKQKRET